MTGLISFLIWLLILLIIFGVIWYILDLLPIPQPPKNIIKIVVGLILVLILLAQLGGYVPVLSRG